MSLCRTRLYDKKDLYIVTSYNKQGSSLVTANISIVTNVYEYYPVTPQEFQEIYMSH